MEGYYINTIVGKQNVPCIVPHENLFKILDNNIYQVESHTICQYTGLTDKNGKKIWENDIIKEFNSSGDEWNLSQVVFADYSLNIGWCTRGVKTLHPYNHRLFNVGLDLKTAEGSEVIGNIFDNPELLVSDTVGTNQNRLERVK